MKSCPECQYTSVDTAKHYVNCGKNLQAVASEETCYVIVELMAEKDTYRIISHPSATLEALKNANGSMLSHLTRCKIIHCFKRQLTQAEPFSPINHYTIEVFGEVKEDRMPMGFQFHQPSE